MLLRSVCVVVFGLVLPPHPQPLSPVPGARGGLLGWFCPLTPDPSCPFRGRGEAWGQWSVLKASRRRESAGVSADRAGFGLLSDTFSELEEVEDHEWAGAADIAVGGARKPVRDDSAAGQFRDVDDAEGWLDAS